MSQRREGDHCGPAPPCLSVRQADNSASSLCGRGNIRLLINCVTLVTMGGGVMFTLPLVFRGGMQKGGDDGTCLSVSAGPLCVCVCTIYTQCARCCETGCDATHNTQRTTHNTQATGPFASLLIRPRVTSSSLG